MSPDNNPMPPGAKHNWDVSFTGEPVVFQVSAIPVSSGGFQALHVTELSVSVNGDGRPHLDYNVVNDGTSPIIVYSTFILAGVVTDDSVNERLGEKSTTRIFAIHDAAGTISEIVANTDDRVTARIVRDGLTMTEVQAPDDLKLAEQIVEAAKGDKTKLTKLSEFVRNYRVQPAEPKLAKLERK
jgi:hypothetical protein